MFTYEFTPQALKLLKKLPADTQKRIISKLDYYVSAENPLVYAESLINSELGQYRFRIGNHRVIFDIDDETIVILTLGHRREIYK